MVTFQGAISRIWERKHFPGMVLGLRQVIWLCLLSNSRLLILKCQIWASAGHAGNTWFYQNRGQELCARWLAQVRWVSYPLPTLVARYTEGHIHVSLEWPEGRAREPARKYMKMAPCSDTVDSLAARQSHCPAIYSKYGKCLGRDDLH